jgi:phenylpropionate dioxygenase-like ring-hydroxylating dioxygenase large terminal subunit
MSSAFERVRPFDIAGLKIGLDDSGQSAIDSLTVHANWKTMYENYAPNVYHESFVHAMYRKSPHSPRVDEDGKKTYEEIIDREGFIGLQYDNAIAGSFYPDSPFPPIREAGCAPCTKNLIVNGFPNWAVTILSNFARMSFWLPTGPDHCEQHIATYFYHDASLDPELATQRARAARGGVIAREEDNAVCVYPKSETLARRAKSVLLPILGPTTLRAVQLLVG